MDEIQSVATTCWFVEAYPTFFCVCVFFAQYSRVRTVLAWFLNYRLNVILCQDTCELICFKLGLMLNTTELYTLIPVWMTLMFTQDHRVTGKLVLVQSLCCKVAWSNANVCDGWLIREMTMKKSCKYCEYGLFEHLLFLSLYFIILHDRYIGCLKLVKIEQI